MNKQTPTEVDIKKAKEYLSIFQTAYNDLGNHRFYFENFGNDRSEMDNTSLSVIHQIVDDLYYRIDDNEEDIVDLLDRGRDFLKNYIKNKNQSNKTA